jgi:ribosomal protein S27AE
MEDLISRQKAINVIERMRAYIGHNMERAVGAAFIEILDDIGEDIGRLPSAQPKRGKWIEDRGQQILMQNFIERGEVWRVCSICGAGHMIGHKYAIDKAYHDRHHNFCPNCGADMRGEENG